MTTYYATYETNTGTRLMNPWRYGNKRLAISEIREAAKAETFIGGYANVKVWTDDPSNPVYEARINVR